LMQAVISLCHRSVVWPTQSTQKREQETQKGHTGGEEATTLDTETRDPQPGSRVHMAPAEKA
jgi:hypothetical protein